ncbi:MAG TPA: hypothetical protein VF791_21790 [Pyrinomonadaceae bacterium]
MKRFLLITLLLIAATVSPIHAAPAPKIDEELTAEETRESLALAEAFARRLAETKDITPVIKELLVPDYLERLMANEPENSSFLFIERDVARRVGKIEARRYYLATMNFWYLHELYVYSKHSAQKGDPPDDVYPVSLLRQLRRTDTLVEKIKNVRQLRTYNSHLERLTALLRADVIRRKAEGTATYKESVAAWDERFHHFKPWVTVCDASCYDLPAGTRLITINVPSFQLQIARVGANYRIVSAMPYID